MTERFLGAEPVQIKFPVILLYIFHVEIRDKTPTPINHILQFAIFGVSLPFNILDTVLNTNVAQCVLHEVDCVLQYHTAVANIVKQVAEKTH
jgi:hypothetical protein